MKWECVFQSQKYVVEGAQELMITIKIKIPFAVWGPIWGLRSAAGGCMECAALVWEMAGGNAAKLSACYPTLVGLPVGKDSSNSSNNSELVNPIADRQQLSGSFPSTESSSKCRVVSIIIYKNGLLQIFPVPKTLSWKNLLWGVPFFLGSSFRKYCLNSVFFYVLNRFLLFQNKNIFSIYLYPSPSQLFLTIYSS